MRIASTLLNDGRGLKALSGLIAKGHHCDDITAFNALMLQWLAETTESTIGHGASGGWVTVPIGPTLCRLQADTNREGVRRWLDAVLTGNGAYCVVESTKGVPHRVAPGVTDNRISGFFLYTEQPFDEPDFLVKPVQQPHEFDIVDVAIKILEAVQVLHARGLGQVRIFPGLSGSGMHWRTSITTAENIVSEDGWIHLRDMDAAYNYTTGNGNDVAGVRVEHSTVPEQLAMAILPHISGPTSGEDAEYAAWFGGLVAAVRQTRRLPIAYKDWPDDLPGWELDGALRYAEPPGHPSR